MCGLNMMMPLMAHNILESIRLLVTSSRNMTERCVRGLQADEERCRRMIEESLAMCTALVPKIGYDAAASIAKEAYSSGRTVREVASERNVLSADELEAVLNPADMTKPGIRSKGE